MPEGSTILRFLGLEIHAYGLMVMLGCWAALGVLWFVTRRDEKSRQAALLGMVIALPLGLMLARLMYVLLDPGFRPLLNLKNALWLTGGGFAMFGALLGAVLACLLAAKIRKVPALSQLDALAPALAAFMVPARLGEGFTTLGISRPLTTGFLKQSFLAVQDSYDAYLRTYLLEALVALAMLIVLLRVLGRVKKPGLAFTWFCLLFGLSQTLMESLRFDAHLRFSFIGVQQVLSAVLFSLTLLILAIRALKRRKKALPIATFVLLPLVLLAIVGVEFLVDRSQLGKLFSYGLYLLVLAIPATLGILMLKSEENLGQIINGPHQ